MCFFLSSFLYLSSKIFFCLTGFFNKYENVIHVNRRTYVDRKDDSRQFKGSVFVLFKVNAYKLCTSTFIDNYPMQLHTYNLCLTCILYILNRSYFLISFKYSLFLEDIMSFVIFVHNENHLIL